MPRSRRRPATPFDPFGAWVALAARGGEMLMASQQVIAARSARIAAAGAKPTLADQREFTRMVSEKVDAFSRSALGAAAAWTPGMQALSAQAVKSWAALASGGLHLASSRDFAQVWLRQAELTRRATRHMPVLWQASEAQARLIDTALDPVHRAATANSRRLGRRTAAKTKARGR